MPEKRTYAPKEHSPLASIEDWEDFVVVRYPEEGKPANAEKDKDAYRNYDHPARDSVREFYRLNHTYQTYDFVREKEAEFLKFDRKEMMPWEAVEYLNTLVDDSDPDIDLSQLDHLLQTAEAIRADGHPDWFVLTGLIHDLGKVLCLFGECQWAADFPAKSSTMSSSPTIPILRWRSSRPPVGFTRRAAVWITFTCPGATISTSTTS